MLIFARCHMLYVLVCILIKMYVAYLTSVLEQGSCSSPIPSALLMASRKQLPSCTLQHLQPQCAGVLTHSAGFVGMFS